MKTPLKITLIGLGILGMSQFLSPKKNNGNLQSVNSFLDDTRPPEPVKAILQESCYDCHSSYTRYPKYANITPVNFWMAQHIEEGKEHLDFSMWNSYSEKQKEHKLEELIEEVEEGEMPLKSYTWTHSEAKLSPTQIEAIKQWAQLARVKYQLKLDPQ